MEMTDQDQIQQLTAQLAQKDNEIKRLSYFEEVLKQENNLPPTPSPGHMELELKFHEQAAQLAAAKEALEFIGTHTDHGDNDPCPICEAVDKALATPSPAADALLEDKARLDWLETTATGLEQHYNEDLRKTEWWTEDGYDFIKSRYTVREAIDAARKASTKEGA